MTDEVLKLALDALEGFIPYLPLKDETQCNRYDKAITALRLVIDMQNMASKSTYKEQLETKDEEERSELCSNYGGFCKKQWVWLTDKEVDECLQGLPTQTIDVYARRIETKIKDKNT